jgi:hypothetical protein
MIHSIWNKTDCPSSERSQLLYQFIKAIKMTAVIQLDSKRYSISLSQGNVHTKMKRWGVISMGFNLNRLTIAKISCFHQILEETRNTFRQYIYYSQTSRLEGSIVQYSRRVWVPKESVKLIKIVLN